MSAHAAAPSADEVGPALAVYRSFRGLIVAGQLGAGERLPTVRQTAADLGIAPGTAAKAYKMLERDGLVVTRTAAGTRVAEGSAVLPGTIVRRLRELIEAADAAGAEPEDVLDALRLMWRAPSARPSASSTPEHLV